MQVARLNANVLMLEAKSHACRQYNDILPVSMLALGVVHSPVSLTSFEEQKHTQPGTITYMSAINF